MKIDDLLLLTLDNLRAHRFRAALTALGIAIGIAAVIAVVAVGQGGQAALLGEIEKMGSSRGFRISVDVERGEAPTADTFRLEDVSLIKELSPAVEKLAPVTSGMFISLRSPSSQGKSVYCDLIGTTPDIQAVMNLPLVAGHFFTETDVQAHRRVVVLESKLARSLFPDGHALGRQIFIQDTPATIVGIVESPSSGLFSAMTHYAFVPITFAQEVLNTRVIQALNGVAVSEVAVPQAISDCIKILERRHPGLHTHYVGRSMKDMLSLIEKATGIMTLIIGSVAAIALLVGGVGVMNIMLVAVTERTREVGLLMALGARRRDILQQFLAEAVALCLAGGAFGVLIGAGGAWAVAHFAHWPPLISFKTVLLAFAFASAVGLVFGLYPASRAASLSPAEALRHQ
ncbi:ABC transporter permease [Ammonifex thiophilus]|uniref:ABC transporter permease n=1 Tax=Ammonifex thiophilus TaxID=444093 RepID=A0A3D8P8F9_9THEO|nr:ABC transporter permease [Ammonifex thiophilus]RDV84719.1 ABC transporter permease [Ammonifex thiophilus]